MKNKQRTISKPVSVTGIGLHSGLKTTLVFKPSSMIGIRFIRVDLPGSPTILLNPSVLIMDKSISRCTAIEDNGARVTTIEHVLAALSGLGLDHMIIEIDGLEAPGMDGSSREFTDALLSAGIVDLELSKEVYVITSPLRVEHQGAYVMVVPAEKFSITYHLDYDHQLLRNQRFSFEFGEMDFKEELACARTFCLESETKVIRETGLGKGANSTNTLIMGQDGPIDNTLRFDDECCRHKALDILGDLYTLGFTICGAVYGFKSGHSLNRALVKKILQQRTMHMTSMNQPQRVFEIDAIKKILPHRYPFLFVDKVIEVEKGVRGIGIKNVTANDGFFMGHFPEKPVMPGVIMIEAMAQSAGVLLLTGGNHDGKVALFMAIDDVKFRRVVTPGDQFVMEIEILRDRTSTAQVKGIARVDGEVVVEAMMIFSYTDASFLTENKK